MKICDSIVEHTVLFVELIFNTNFPLRSYYFSMDMIVVVVED